MEASARPAPAGSEVLRPPGELRLPPALAQLRQRRVDVVGVASVEGGEMARYLLAAGFTNLVGHDQQPDRQGLARAHHRAHAGLGPEEREGRLRELLDGLASLQIGPDYLRQVESSALVIPTQAWFLSPANAPLQELRRKGHPFYSLIQAYLDLARGEVIGVTGSHGKSTTSALLAAVLEQTGIFPAVWLAGNDRHTRQALEAVARDPGQGCLILEISNRQLLQMDRAPRVACLTNITANHLDEHGGMAGYVLAKQRIFALPGCRVAVRNGDDPLSLSGDLATAIREFRFAATEAGLAGHDGAYQLDQTLQLRWQGESRPVLPVDRVPLRGQHNLANVGAALSLLAAVSEPDPAALELAAAAIERFTPLRHRTELVRERAGVEYVDDLSSTTPQSTVAAIRALGKSCILIAGGQDKGIGFGELVGLVGGEVRAVILLPGEGSDRLAAELAEAGREELLHRVGRLRPAVELARNLAQAGEAVLLSPACPGFFTAHYGEGGFRQAVLRATSPRPRREPA
jgi:UDP-N-acetylmuramoylalanine--D-glutamate ligase